MARKVETMPSDNIVCEATWCSNNATFYIADDKDSVNVCNDCLTWLRQKYDKWTINATSLGNKTSNVDPLGRHRAQRDLITH